MVSKGNLTNAVFENLRFQFGPSSQVSRDVIPEHGPLKSQSVTSSHSEAQVATIMQFRIVQAEGTRHGEPVANCDRFSLKPQFATVERARNIQKSQGIA